jgi:hypothetical protein
MDDAWSGGGCETRPSGAGDSPRAAVLGHAREWQGKGERELAGGPTHGVDPAYQRGERESSSVGLGGARARFQMDYKIIQILIQTRPNLILSI